jgi:hypothetical protein
MEPVNYMPLKDYLNITYRGEDAKHTNWGKR